ncbi:hypothetical protein AB6A40_003444 [Gnathostoma spinigerum]|uniref:Uncharacterized protein n=1 Tax=Gnathostoma spinigerum TaxID=75299 RepID=A0ABD6EAS5_9BILA
MNADQTPHLGNAETIHKEHVPDWAFIVIIISIILSAIAFCIGNCINKRASLRPLAHGITKEKNNKRSWGAGFSGGIWGAA